MTPPDIRPALPSDWPAIEALLQSHALPTDGARAHLDTFVVALRGGTLIGVAGLEVYGDAALLRSVAVADNERCQGIGRALLDVIVPLAQQHGVATLYLLTTTAADYFARQGFVRVARETAPAALQASAEFRGACPASAVFMARPLRSKAGASIAIRSATPDDADAIAAIYAPIVRHTTISFEWEPPTADDFRARIAKVLARYPWLVALDEQRTVAGFVYAGTHRDPPSYQWSVNTSAFMRADKRGRGIGKALYNELFRQLVDLGYYRAYAGIALPNAASVALHESVGFRKLGVYEDVGWKFGAWRSVGWWQRALQPSAPDPVPPRVPAR